MTTPHDYFLKNPHEYCGTAGFDRLTQCLRQHLKSQPAHEGTVILADIGTCVGQFIPRLTQFSSAENVLLLCYEPNPFNIEVLSKLKPGIQFRLFPCALSNAACNHTLSTIIDHPENRTGYTLASLNGDGEPIAEVKVETFDQTIEQLAIEDYVIRFVKIDTEGNDTNVIRGMERNLGKTQYILFESSDCLDDRRGPGEEKPLQSIVKFLDQRGFATYKMGDKRLLKMNGPDWHHVYEDVKFHSNSFALRKDDSFVERFLDSEGYFKPAWLHRRSLE